MEISIRNQDGDTVETANLDDAVFNVPMNHSLVHQVLVGYQLNKRQGTHDTKTRAQVSGGGRKPWIQKHTGRAMEISAQMAGLACEVLDEESGVNYFQAARRVGALYAELIVEIESATQTEFRIAEIRETLGAAVGVEAEGTVRVVDVRGMGANHERE